MTKLSAEQQQLLLLVRNNRLSPALRHLWLESRGYDPVAELESLCQETVAGKVFRTLDNAMVNLFGTEDEKKSWSLKLVGAKKFASYSIQFYDWIGVAPESIFSENPTQLRKRAKSILIGAAREKITADRGESRSGKWPRQASAVFDERLSTLAELGLVYNMNVARKTAFREAEKSLILEPYTFSRG